MQSDINTLMSGTDPIGLAVCNKCAKKYAYRTNFYIEYNYFRQIVITMVDYEYAKWRYDSEWIIPNFPVKIKI